MVYLIGASGHARVIIEILEQANETIGGLVDQDESIDSLFGYKVCRELPTTFRNDSASIIVTIGDNAIRKQIVSKNTFTYSSAIHPRATISKRAIIGKGTVVMSGVSVNSNVVVGAHSILNTNATIEHDCILEDFVHISPNATLAGDVFVGEGTHIGINACVIPGIKIGKWCTIGAGAVIIKDIPDGATVVGNPGRIIKMKEIVTRN